MKYDMKALAHDFWYGKPHQERRLGDLYIDKTGLYKHREWRGFKDTMYYFYNIWMFNHPHTTKYHLFCDFLMLGDKILYCIIWKELFKLPI